MLRHPTCTSPNDAHWTVLSKNAGLMQTLCTLDALKAKVAREDVGAHACQSNNAWGLPQACCRALKNAACAVVSRSGDLVQRALG